MILDYITWNVDPEIFKLGPFSVRWYGLLFAAGFYLGYLMMGKFFKRESISEKHLDTLLVYMFLGTVIGARLGHCLFYEPEYYLTHPVEIFKIWRGGLASHGGAIGILIALHFFSRKTKLSYLWTLDRVVIATALAAFFIRMGNLMNSEIYGYQTELPWGFIFVRNDEVVPKHPTQIYEALSYLVIFIILRLIYRNAPKGNVLKGSLLGLFLMLVFGARFFIEFVKEVQVEKELAWSMKLGQWLSIPFVITGLLLVLNAFRNKNKPATKK